MELGNWRGISAIFLMSVVRCAAPARADLNSKAQILAEAEKTAEAQVAALNGKTPIDWVGGVMYAGFADFSHMTDNPTCEKALEAAGVASDWKLRVSKDPFLADDFCMGQAFLDFSVSRHDAKIIEPLKLRLDSLVDHLNAEPADVKKLTWWWCDALFMAPPLMARMSAESGDKKYIDAMDKEWGRTFDLLYDQQEHLFFRDSAALKQVSKNGKKAFWSRGNGWVIGGLARMLQWMPKDYPTRPKYVKLYQDMAGTLVSLQRPDGTWSSSLLDPEQFPSPEFSGTALDCYGLAWGVNNGILDREKSVPVIGKAWAALLAARQSDGLPVYVQLVARSPGLTKPSGTQLYATGQFLLAATELAKLAPMEIPTPPTLIPAVPTTVEITPTTRESGTMAN